MGRLTRAACFTMALLAGLGPFFYVTSRPPQRGTVLGSGPRASKVGPASIPPLAHGFDAQRRHLLQGVWTLDPTENAYFTIAGDRVIFFDAGDEAVNQHIRFTLQGNRLSFDYAGAFVVTDSILQLTPDSLVLGRDGMITRLVRVK